MLSDRKELGGFAPPWRKPAPKSDPKGANQARFLRRCQKDRLRISSSVACRAVAAVSAALARIRSTLSDFRVKRKASSLNRVISSPTADASGSPVMHRVTHQVPHRVIRGVGQESPRPAHAPSRICRRSRYTLPTALARQVAGRRHGHAEQLGNFDIGEGASQSPSCGGSSGETSQRIVNPSSSHRMAHVVIHSHANTGKLATAAGWVKGGHGRRSPLPAAHA